MEKADVEKVLVDGGENDAAAGEQFPEIGIAGVGELCHLVIMVDDQRQWEGVRAIGIPDASIQRELVHVEAPVFLARPTLPTFEVLKKVGGIDGAGFDSHARTVLGAANIVSDAVEEREHAIGAFGGGIGSRKLCGHGIGRRFPGEQLV